MIPSSEILKNPTTGSCEKSTEKAFIATSSGKYRLEDDRGTFITMLITLLLRLLCTLMTKSRLLFTRKRAIHRKEISMVERSHSVEKTIVLVHGGFVDGSGWEGVYRILKKDGYRVAIVQNPTLSLADDVAATKRIIHAQNGPVILVGHSYGGAVITEAGNDPQVAGLVYIAAFAPDKGESVATLIQDPPPGAPVPPILPPEDGFLLLDKTKFAAAFAGDVDPEKAAFMADSQVPWGIEALSGALPGPAWRTKPSWYLVSTD